ncbi:MAG TPA: glycosyltransferase family 1 protein [Desulfonatronum sp.]|nr:glycosyltransferase family 1 protein [Desulfonatronum sp.]
MRIGLNLLYLLPGIVGGTETYAAGLLQGLAEVDDQNDYLVFVNAESAFWSLPKTKNIQRIVCPVRAQSRLKRLVHEQFALPGLAKAHRLDLLHSLGYIAPLRLPCPGVVTIHDMNTKGHGRSMGLPKRLLLSFLVRRSAQSSTHVITVSEFSKQEILSHLHLVPKKISVIHEAPLRGRLTADTPGSPDVPRPYILAFASLSPHKNIPRLIEAFALLAPTIPHQLVLAGHIPADGGITQAIARCDLARRVTLAGYLPREKVHALLSAAELFVFPSLYEGFGLPVLEAQARGAVVACANQGALPEVAGNGAAFFAPESARDMAEVIRRCLFDLALRQRLQAMGQRNLDRFSWNKTAQETIAVYERISQALTTP